MADTQVVVPPTTEERNIVCPALFPFLDLRSQFAAIESEVLGAIGRVMRSQAFILGPEVEHFERALAEFLAQALVIGCASGSDALLLALMCLGVKPGDEVITTPFTFVATAGSIARLGATPVFVDIDPATLNIDVADIANAISSRTRAIIPVHLFGLPADMDDLCRHATRAGLAVIEDSAQALGASFHTQPVGTIGDFGCFSFFPSKNLGGAGDGGAITCKSSEAFQKLRMLRVHGSGKRYHYDLIGVNSRLDALQAAILKVKLSYLPQWTSARRAKADAYRQMFADLVRNEHVVLPPEIPGRYHVYNQFVIRTRERDRLRRFLQQRGIPTEVYYPMPLHLQPAFRYLGYREGQLPVAETASRDVLALPIYPELKLDHQITVVNAIRDFYLDTQSV